MYFLSPILAPLRPAFFERLSFLGSLKHRENNFAIEIEVKISMKSV